MAAKQSMVRRASPMLQALEKEGDAVFDISTEYKVYDIDISLIDDPSFHDRSDWDERAIDDLADNIAANGLLQPIIVREKNGRFERVVGFRRLMAYKRLGKKTIPAKIIKVSDDIALFKMLSENLKRENLNAYDEFVAIMRLCAMKLGMDSAEFSSFIYRLKNNRSGDKLTKQEIVDRELLVESLRSVSKLTLDGVFRRMLMLNLPEALKKRIKSRELSFLVALALGKFSSFPDFEEVIGIAIKEKLTQRDIEKMYIERCAPKNEPASNPFKMAGGLSKNWKKLSSEKKAKVADLFAQIEKIIKEEG